MSDNEQFDKLIKEKVDGKKYPYSASSWHSFKSKAGLKSTLSTVYSVLIGAASVVVVGVGCYLGYRHFNRCQTPFNPIRQSQFPPILRWYPRSVARISLKKSLRIPLPKFLNPQLKFLIKKLPPFGPTLKFFQILRLLHPIQFKLSLPKNSRSSDKETIVEFLKSIQIP